MDLGAIHLEKYGRASALSSKEYTVGNNRTDLEASYYNELEALSLYSKACTVLEFPIFKSNFAVFNDTALHFLAKNTPLPKISETKPRYQLFKHEIVM